MSHDPREMRPINNHQHQAGDEHDESEGSEAKIPSHARHNDGSHHEKDAESEEYDGGVTTHELPPDKEQLSLAGAGDYNNYSIYLQK